MEEPRIPTDSLQPPEEDPLKPWAERRPDILTSGFWVLLEQNAATWASEITAGPFWQEAGRRLVEWRADYRASKKADLLPSPGLPSFVHKGKDSCRRKVRKNCRTDSGFQAFAPAGPPVPRLQDLVRTRITCRYVDGVEFLTTKLLELATELKLDPSRSREGRVEGYFAQHLDFSHEVFFREAGVPNPTSIQCEIQVATELATKMWDASHPFYEDSRELDKNDHEWQWRPEDPKFIAYQLGHVIHLADGLIVNLRDNSSRKKDEPK